MSEMRVKDRQQSQREETEMHSQIKARWANPPLPWEAPLQCSWLKATCLRRVPCGHFYLSRRAARLLTGQHQLSGNWKGGSVTLCNLALCCLGQVYLDFCLLTYNKSKRGDHPPRQSLSTSGKSTVPLVGPSAFLSPQPSCNSSLDILRLPQE